MTQEQLQALQAELDVKKWNDTQAKGGMDTCGSYDYCVSCDKSIAFPCATAKTKFETPAPAKKKSASKSTKKPATETATATSDKVVRVRKTSTKKA